MDHPLTPSERNALEILGKNDAEEQKGRGHSVLTILTQKGFVKASPYTKSETGFESRIVSITDAGRAALERSEG